MSAITVHRAGDTVSVTIDGVVGVHNRRELRDAVIDALEAGARTVTVDLAHCGYMDTSGLGVLVSVARSVRLAGGTLQVVNPNEDLRTLFELTKLDRLLLGEVPAA